MITNGHQQPKQACIDTLRLSAEQQQEILAELDNAPGGLTRDDRRIDQRLIYQRQAGLIVQMRHPGGTVATYVVQARNLSTSGIGFLHGSFVYPGTHCSMALITINNSIVRAEGQVVRCRLVKKHVHEVGLRFDQPVRLHDFVAGRPVIGGDDREQVPQLGGLVLYVEDSFSEQELLKYHLGKAGVKVHSVPNGLAAVDLATHTNFDAVITALWLPVMSGTEVAKCLRDGGYAGPIIVLSADDRPEMRQEAISRGCTCVLTKPYRPEQLLEILAEHLPKVASDSDPPLMSELWGDLQIRPLVRTYLKHLGQSLSQIQRLLAKGARDILVQKLCLDVKGSAGGYGYPQIGTVAGELLQMLMSGAGPERRAELCEAMLRLWQSAVKGVEKGGGAGPTAAVA